MYSLEPKKLALLRILQILEEHSDCDHPLTQEMILKHLEGYGIILDRKTVSANINLLKEADYDIESGRSGTYLASRKFENAELRLLIDGVLSSKYITSEYSKDLIDRLCSLSSKYFRAGVKNIYSVNDWGKTDNKQVFYNIDIVNEAIEKNCQIRFTYNKFGIDKRLHKGVSHIVSPYQLILHNQKYYLMTKNETYNSLAYFRVDHITDMKLLEKVPRTDIRELEGFENGINYKDLSLNRPYMYTDRLEYVELYTDEQMIDSMIGWFGYDIVFKQEGERIRARLKVSLQAMEYWALQYVNRVEIISPSSLREKIKQSLENGLKKYK